MKNKVYILILLLLSAILSSSVHFEHDHSHLGHNHSHLEHSYNHNDYTEAQIVASERRVQFEGDYYGFNEDDFLAVDEPSVPLESEITFIVKEPQEFSSLIAERPSSKDSMETAQEKLKSHRKYVQELNIQ